MSQQLIVNKYDFTQFTKLVEINNSVDFLLPLILNNDSNLSVFFYGTNENIQKLKQELNEEQVKNSQFHNDKEFISLSTSDSIYIINNSSQNYSEEELSSILKNLRKVMGINGRLLLIKKIETSTEQSDAAYRDWFTKLGFVFTSLLTLENNLLLLEAVRK